jgi:FG-GAP repeat
MFSRANLSESYVNAKNGLEHWLKLQQRPAGTGTNVWIQFAISGASQPKLLSNRAIELKVNHHVLSYGGLKVWDASGKPLTARLAVTGRDAAICIDDSNATYPITVDPVWTQQQKLTEPVPGKDYRFGNGIAISGDTAVIGSPNNNVRRGAAYVFNRTGSVWTFTQKLQPTDIAANNFFGLSTTIAGDRIAVGAYGQNAFAGAVYIYKRANGTWTQQTKIDGPGGAAGYFGYDVSLSGSSLLAGCDGQASDRGFAYVYVEKDGVWSLQQRLGAKDGIADDTFGWSLAIDGDVALISAQGKDNNKGAAYTFTRTGTKWQQEQKIAISTGQDNDSFGYGLSLSGDTAVISAFGANAGLGRAYIYKHASGAWTQVQSIDSPDASNETSFAYATSLVGDRLALATQADTGVVYIYDRVSGTFNLSQRLAASDSDVNDYFGQSISLDGTTALVSAIDNLSFQGAVYSFELTETKLSVSFDVSSILGGNTGSGTVSLNTPAPTEGLTVTLASDQSALQIPATVTIPGGSSSASFDYTTSTVSDDVTAKATATATGWLSGNAFITIQAPKTIAIAFSPAIVRGGDSTVGTITLGRVAPKGGLTVALTANKTALTVPGTVLVPEGSKTVTFDASSVVVASDTFVKVTASSPDWPTASTTVVVESAATEGIRFDPAILIGGTGTTGTYTRTYESAGSAITVQLSSADASVSVPASITLDKDVTSVTFPVTTTAVPTDKAVTITATHDGLTFNTDLSVLAPTVTDHTISPAAVTASQPATGTVTISGPAPTGGLPVTLSTDNKAAAAPTVTKVIIPKDATSATYSIKTNLISEATTVNFSATTGSTTLTAPLRIKLPQIDLFVRPAIFLAGDKITVIGKIRVQVNAPKAGLRFYLSSSDPNVTVPESAIVHFGSNTISFPITHSSVRSRRTVTISARSDAGSTSGTCILNANKISAFTISPATVKGGNGTVVTGTVTVRFPAPEGGLVVSLQSFTRKITVPDSVTILKGQTKVSFNIEHTAVPNKLGARVKASVLSSSRIATLRLTKR